MMFFIYVFTEEDCNTLIDAGYTLLKSDKCNSMFVFKNDNTIEFDLSKIKYVLSSVLTF